MSNTLRRGDRGLGKTPGGGTAGSFAAHDRAASPAPPSASADAEIPVEHTSYRSEIDGAIVIELDSFGDVGRIRVNLNDSPIYDDNPESPEPHSPFGDLSQRTPKARQAAVRAALLEHLKEFPEDAYGLIDTATDAARSAKPYFPEIRVQPGDEDEGTEPQIINPRTGRPDVLIAVDSSVRWTELDDYSIDMEGKSVQFDYDSSADYDGVLYITESDKLPVNLPEGWAEH